jgi:hypothetical protein
VIVGTLQPVGAGGDTEQQHAFRHGEFGRDGVGGGCFGHGLTFGGETVFCHVTPIISTNSLRGADSAVGRLVGTPGGGEAASRH